LLLLIPAVGIARARLRVCESKPHLGARRAPIPGASGDPADFGCSTIDPVTLTEKGIDLSFCLLLLATLRSMVIDGHVRKLRRLAAQPPSERPPRRSMRDAFSNKPRPGR
jgi:hypothetical protein